jgi:hypothetical protein
MPEAFVNFRLARRPPGLRSKKVLYRSSMFPSLTSLIRLVSDLPGCIIEWRGTPIATG